MEEICQSALPIRPWADPRLNRLPGLNPVAPGEWLIVDDAYGGQMSYRDRLLAERREAVIRLDPVAHPAASELLAAVLTEISGRAGFSGDDGNMRCPDGRVVPIDHADPLGTIGRLVQEDFALMQRLDGASEHLLTGAVLCFPASWSLDEKFLRPLTGIHVPVASYNPDMARRVQRLFDGIQPGRPIWRANALVYGDPTLHQPRREGERRKLEPGGRRWMRVERQTLNRLPETDAVVFSIHTYVVPFESLVPEDRAAFPQ